jgi:fatty-acid desaturase
MKINRLLLKNNRYIWSITGIAIGFHRQYHHRKTDLQVYQIYFSRRLAEIASNIDKFAKFK